MKLLNNLSLRVKILASFAISSGLAAIGITAFAIHLNTKTLETGIVSKARTIHSRLEAATDYVATQGGLKPAVDRLVGKYKDASELSDKEKLEVLQQVPIFSAMKIGAKDAEKENYKFRVFSDEPRRKENLATPDELAIFKKFEADPQLKEWVANTGNSIIVYRPARLQEKQGCLVCHGHPSTSPWKNGKDILGYKMENWADQKLHGVFAIETNIAEAKAVASAGEWISTDKLIGTLVLSGTFLALIVTGFMVNGPLSALRGIAGRLDEASLQVEHSADSVSQSSQSISQASTEQSAAIVETSASTEEMSSMVNKNAENAARTSSLSSQSLKAAERGQTVVMQMLEAVKEISESSKRSQDLSAESNKEIESMVNLIQEISTKTRVINDIVFQTKLLSFNASVEAARAGEHGKGFAVVAEEVGNLAQMSGNASKEISTLLEDSVRRVTGIVQKNKETSSTQAEDINKRVDLGRKVAEECSQVLSEILGDAKKVADMAEEIAAASREQATGVTEITRAMSQLDQATQSNAAVSAESAKSANGLNQQASVLKRLVMTLRETLDGGQSASGYSPDHSAHSAPKHEAPTAVVLPMKKKKETAVAEKKATEGAPLKAAAGDGSLPSRNDQRFTDV